MVVGGIDAPQGVFTEVYRDLAKFISTAVDEVILVKGKWRDEFSPEFRRQISADSRLEYFKNVKSIQEGVETVLERAKTDDVVLIKGRTNEELRRIAQSLMETTEESPNGMSLDQ